MTMEKEQCLHLYHVLTEIKEHGEIVERFIGSFKDFKSAQDSMMTPGRKKFLEKNGTMVDECVGVGELLSVTLRTNTEKGVRTVTKRFFESDVTI